MGLHVLLSDPEELAVRTGDVARILAKAMGVPMADVAQRVRNGGGIVARDLPDEAASEVVAKLGASGMAAFTVPAAPAVTLPRARRFAGLVLGPEGLEGLVRGSTRREKLPWTRVRALHVTAVARELTPEEEEEGLKPRSMVGLENLPEEVRRISGELDFWEDRERRRVDLCLELVVDDSVLVGRVFAEDADYSMLEGKSDNSLANFVTLVRALIAKAPVSVVIPPATRRFASAADWEGVLYDKPEARDAFNLWLLLAARHGTPFPGRIAEDVQDLDDQDVEDPEEAIEVGEDEAADAEDAPEDDAEDEDADDGDEDEDADDGDEDEDDEDDDDREGSSEENLKAAGGDVELAKTLELFDKTSRFNKAEIAEALANAQKKPDEDPKANTGRWDVSELLGETDKLEGKDLTTGAFNVADIVAAEAEQKKKDIEKQ